MMRRTTRRGHRAGRRDGPDTDLVAGQRRGASLADTVRDLQRRVGNRATATTVAVLRDRLRRRTASSRGMLYTVATPPGVRTTSQVLSWHLVGGGKHRTADGQVETGQSRLVARIRKGPRVHPLGIGEIHAGAEFNQVRLDVTGGGSMTFHDARVVMYDALNGAKTPEVTFVYGRMDVAR